MVTSPVFQHLFTPFTIGSMTVRNRIVVPAHGTLYMPQDGLPTERMLNYWLSKARGGVGHPPGPFSVIVPVHGYRAHQISGDSFIKISAASPATAGDLEVPSLHIFP